MFDTQTTQTKVDESNRNVDRSWLSMEDERRFGVVHPHIKRENKEERGWMDAEASNAHFEGLISIGQKVFLPGDLFIGLTTKLFLNPTGQLSHLAIRAARLFGHHKMVPIASVSDVTKQHVMLSIDRDQFNDLPEYQSDAILAEEADRALWNDVVLRDTDYYQIDVVVRDGIAKLRGHVISSMNQWRAETAVKNLPGILGVKSYLVPDDKLLIKVAEALGQIEPGGDGKFFPKVENGLAVLMGEVSSSALRDQAGQCVAEIPWLRGVINKIQVTGEVDETSDQRFLQPVIGKDLLFKDALTVTIRKVIINPENRRVVAMVVLGRFPDPLWQEPGSNNDGGSNPEQQMVLPIDLILYLTRSTGFLKISSDETAEYHEYDPTRYIAPDRNWMPPYPYCTDEVLFLAASSDPLE